MKAAGGLKVVHLCHNEAGSGAGRAAYRIHRSLLDLGCRSTMLVADKRTADETVHRTAQGPIAATFARLCEFAEARLVRRDVSPGAGHFTPARWGHFRPAASEQVRSADIVCLYWITGAFIRPERLAGIDRPIVWRLSDTWAFTGGCHYPGSCERYVAQCGDCPQLARPGPRDLSRRLWARKSNAWGNLDLTIVAPSEWMARAARRSSLFEDRRVVVIPTGIDLERYRPLDRSQSRARHGIPVDKQVILFGSISPTSDRRKGFEQLHAALEILARGPLADRIMVIMFGGSKQAEAGLPVRSMSLGRIDDDAELAAAYSAADLVVVPSLEDNLPNVALEAIACGAPVVGFDVGGMSDIVRHDWNGALAEPVDPRQLAAQIQRLLEKPKRLAAMSNNARKRAEHRFSLAGQAQAYLDLYRELAERRIGAPA